VESELVDYLRRRIGSHRLLKLGPGDDAAVLRMANVEECVMTVDVLTDHVDFELAEIDPKRAGRKALAVNLSDLAAMASEPLAGVVGLVLPKSGGMQLAVDLYEGLLALAEEFDVAIAGGDTNSWDGPLAISVTLIGRVTQSGPLLRSGAVPGDRVLVTGSFGGSILGHHLDFQPRVNEALALAGRYRLHAGIDVSDGLSIDLGRLATESGCGAVLEAEAIPIRDDARRLAKELADGSSPLDHALGDGEDFELILAVAAEEAERMIAERPLEVELTNVGRFVARPGLWLADSSGGREPLSLRGYQHEFD
jgi:thiamine-monophosphate kinase